MSRTLEEKGIVQWIKKIYFISLGTLMYYFLTEVIDLGIHITYRHAFALLLSFSALCLFLCRPNFPRGAEAVKRALIYSIPLFVTLAVSLLVWLLDQTDVDIISRGLSTSLIYSNMLSFALAAAAFLYVFGEKGIWYNFLSMLLANLLMILTVIFQNGFVPYFRELWVLIISFAGETGDIIVQAEIHELAFCIGAYLIYMTLHLKKKPSFLILFFLGIFCFVSAFKRIGILAIAVALLFAFGLKLVARFHAKTAKGLIVLLTGGVMVLLLFYIAVIRMGAFEMLQKMGVETSGRDSIYRAVERYYTFSPEYTGRGIGFLTYELTTNLRVGVSSVHNDFLQHYIDLGFVGYLIWLFSMTLGRILYFGRKEKTESAILCFCLVIYFVVTSATDNTLNYPLLTCTLAILMMGHGFDRDVRLYEKKLFGRVSEENEESGKEEIF
jgi:hypothetical protein